ncbi:MAG: heavy metal translocating P-type ATPase [Pseudomonadota bacterium]
MTSHEASSPVGCPGCLAVQPSAAGPEPQAVNLMLSLPGIHCQNCIRSVEAVLQSHPAVRSARVNLTLKRALIDADPAVTAEVLADLVETAGFEAHELDASVLGETASAAAERQLLMRVAVAGFASMNVMLLSVAVWSGATDATRDLFHWISAAIALPAIAYAAQPFFVHAWSALRAGRLNMDVPISLAILLALGTSLWETSLSGEHAYFDAAVMLTFFLLAGRWLEARARRAARSAAEELTALEVPRAWRATVSGVEAVNVSALRIGDRVLIKPGARAPVDGEIVEGHSEVDRAALTGESFPEVRGVGQQLRAGEINLTGPLTIRAEAVGRDTSLQRIVSLVAVAESGRSRYTSLADTAAKLYAPGVHILAALAFLGWLMWSGDLRVALNIAAAVLIITCPCALGLAVPAVTTAASGRLFARGMLVKNATALERLAEVDHVVFDKTGTLTMGAPRLAAWETLGAREQALVAGLAAGSPHPLARAVASTAERNGVQPAKVWDVTERPGFGIECLCDQGRARFGRPDWVGCAASGEGMVAALGIEGKAPIVLRFDDTLRPGAAALVKSLAEQGVATSLLTGDRPAAARQAADAIGVRDWYAGVLPEAKIEFVQNLQNRGAKVLMIGDGINDTAALSAAHVSISPAEAMDAARAASDIVLLGRDLSPVGDALQTARLARRRIKQNFRLATCYNVIAVPLAVAGFATPLVAALAMSTSSISVSVNALRLKGSS